MAYFAYVCAHTYNGFEKHPASKGLDHPLDDMSRLEHCEKWEGNWYYWNTVGSPEGGFRLIIDYLGELYGEFLVEKRSEEDGEPVYHRVPSSVYRYAPLVPYSELVSQVKEPEGVSKEQYDDFIRRFKISLIPI